MHFDFCARFWNKLHMKGGDCQ